MIDKFKIAFLLFIIATISLAAQTPMDTIAKSLARTRESVELKAKPVRNNIDNSVYILDGKVITTDEFRAISLSKIKSVCRIKSRENPTFKKYAKEDTDCVEIVTLTDNFEESMLNIKVEPTDLPVIVIDGVGVPTYDFASIVDLNDIESVKVVKDKEISGIFGQHTGGLVFITTKSKTLLNKVLQEYKEAQMKSREKAHREGLIMIR